MKSFLTLLASLVISVLLLEGLSQTLYYFQYGVWYNPERILGALGVREQAPEVKTELFEYFKDQREVVHPYIGFVRDYNKTFRQNFGYDTENFPLQTLSKDKIVVGLFGGSVAMEIHRTLEKVLAKALAQAKDPRKLVFINFGLGGYKQPQQLSALTYFLARGAQFDCVINLDGFNEVALPYAENSVAGISPFYPRLWQLRLSEAMDARMLRAYASITADQEKLDRIVQTLRTPILSQTATWGLLAIWRASGVQKQIKTQLAAIATKHDTLPFVQSGPPFDKMPAQNTMEALAAFWGRCSRIMWAVCQGMGIEYVHVLQPNQYVTDTKSFSEEELSTCYTPETRYAKGAKLGYPALLQTGKELDASGIHYFDATQIFKEHPESVYRDSCCHLNDNGNQLLSSFIVEKIMPLLEAQRTAP